MSDNTDIRSSEAQRKELSAETTISSRQSTQEAMPEDRKLSVDGFSRSAESWKGLIDLKALIEAIYASRRI